MEQFITMQYDAMTRALHQVTISTENNLQRAEQSYLVVQNALGKLKDFIRDYQFKNEQEEIEFFKNAKPQFLAELIYYKEIYQLESMMPVGNKEDQIVYLVQIAKRISLFFERNQFLYNYYRSKKNSLDVLFFKRESEPPVFVPDYSLDMDSHFSTPNSFKFSKILAYERLIGFISDSIRKLETADESTVADQKTKQLPLHVWTDSKAGLIELAYGIFAKGAVDFGKANMKQIIAILEMAFNVTLGNHYAVFHQNIRLRKKNKTVYICLMGEYLTRYMDDLDEHFSG